MRRWILLIILAVTALLPSAGYAQGDVVLEYMSVRLWPEYDQPSLLVIYDLSIASSAGLPVNLTVRIPAEANLVAVAQQDNGRLVNVPYDPPVRQGTWEALSLPVNGLTTYRLEYYIALTKDGNARHFIYEWPGDYAVDTFEVEVQEPVDTTQFSTSPDLPGDGTDREGLKLHRTTLKLAKGEVFKLIVDYQKTGDALSASRLAVQPGDSLDQSSTANATLYTYLPGALAVLGGLLLVGAGVWYWQRGRKRPGRKSHRGVRNVAPGNGDTQIYCPQCGRRAQPGDRFCRTCGARLRLY